MINEQEDMQYFKTLPTIQLEEVFERLSQDLIFKDEPETHDSAIILDYEEWKSDTEQRLDLVFRELARRKYT
jgi:two-component sensor histidine kinase